MNEVRDLKKRKEIQINNNKKNMKSSIDVSKNDENCCKQTLASLPCFGAYR